ncbi:hypothetical protein J4434_02485 [Candidatus Woesearchaeota archaeon]|nr:hypothetical protein [Candidatus Woesearchaeota archaeon]
MEEGINEEVKSIVRTLLTRKRIGGVHTPEAQLFRKFKNIHDKEIRKKIDEDWKQLETFGYLIRMKKRTKKGTDYHVSLNPKRVFEIKEWIEG